MEIEQLYPVVLLLVVTGMLIGVGVLVLDSFGTAAFTDRTVTDESVTWPGLDANVSLANTNLTQFTQITNASGTVLPADNFTAWTTDGTITALDNTTSCLTGASCLASYIWRDYDSNTRTATVGVRGAVSTIATTWLPLIVTIIALAIILVLVVRSFVMKKR